MSDAPRLQPSDPGTRARRCGRCGAAPLQLVRTWEHLRVGVRTGALTHELACRSCGAEVTLHPWTSIEAERCLAWMLMPAVVPGLYFLSRANRRAAAWTDNPVVTGLAPTAAPPSIRPRRCPCGGVGTCDAVVRLGTERTRLGTRYDFRCARCERPFSVHDTAAVLAMLGVTLALLSLGSLVILHPPGAAVGAERSNQTFGVAVVVGGLIAALTVALRVRRRWLHPVG